MRDMLHDHNDDYENDDAEYEAVPVVFFDDDEDSDTQSAYDAFSQESEPYRPQPAAPQKKSWQIAAEEYRSREPESEDNEDDDFVYIPQDPTDEDDYQSSSDSHSSRAAQSSHSDNEDSWRPPISDDEPESDSDDDYDDAVSSFSFGRVNSAKKDKEFIFMPFLDDEPEEEEEQVTLSFSKVKAEKKEKEFVFMPFLDIADDVEEEIDETNANSGRFRSSKGTIIDEGLILRPLEEEPEEEKPEDKEPEQEEDTGISIVEGGGAESLSKPKLPPTGDKNAKKKSSSGGKGSSSKSGSGSKKKLNPEQQFREAMRAVDPEVLAAVRHDPIQRQALEQAVRIALVQQAAHDAVEKATGRSIYGSMMNNGSGSKGGGKSKSGGKKRPPSSQQHKKPEVKSGYGKSIQASGISIFDTSPAEFGVNSSAAPEQPAEFGQPASVPTPPPQPQPQPQPQQTQQKLSSPNANQDPALAVLNGRDSAPSAAQDPALAALNRNNTSPRSTISSPAAVRAAMRNGLDLAQTQTAVAVAAASSQKARTQSTESSSRSGCLVWIIVLFMVFFIGLIGVAVWPAISNEMQYQDAMSSLNSKEYLTAAGIFSELGDYRDSETKLYESIYSYGIDLLNQGKYDSALEQFNTIKENYADAAEAAAQCQYTIGVQLMEAGDYAAAYDQLYTIPKYRDAGDLAIQSNYLCAEQLYLKGDYMGALTRYKMYPDYNDSFEKWQLSQYLYARSLSTSKQYLDAYALFVELDSYNDSMYQAALVQYLVLKEAVEANEPFATPDFTISEILTCMYALEKHLDDPVIVNMLADSVYFPARLLGTWAGDHSSITFEETETGNRLTMRFNNDDTEVFENVVFIGAQVYTRNVGKEGKLINIYSLTGDNPISPNFLIVHNDRDGFLYSHNRTS